MNECWKYWLALAFSFPYVADGVMFRCDYTYCALAQAWFKYHVIPATWHDARLMCSLEGAILASPTTPEIRGTMVKSTGSLDIFVGLHAIFSRGKYYTIDGIPLEQIPHAWEQSEPDNKNNSENCIILNSKGLFSDVSCNDTRPYMCYRSSDEEVNECGTPDPEYRFYIQTDKCYKFHTKPRTFEGAHLACSAEGGHLAIVNSDIEAFVLRQIFNTYPSPKLVGNFVKDVAFIGFYRWGEDGDWRTIHGQTLAEAGYDKFSPGEPSNSMPGEACGSINRSGKLNDIRCDNPFTFICEKSKDYPAVCENNKKVLQVKKRKFRRLASSLAIKKKVTTKKEVGVL